MCTASRPSLPIQPRIALAMNSGPLPDRMCAGAPRSRTTPAGTSRAGAAAAGWGGAAPARGRPAAEARRRPAGGDAPLAGAAPPSELFLHHLPGHLLVQGQLGGEALEAGVLGLQLLEALGLVL